jgi:hypothetical protein|tara:strand:- start:2073 stop:2300 length:228 start_codon:yes stop_codon:yes gene_type:complete
MVKTDVRVMDLFAKDVEDLSEADLTTIVEWGRTIRTKYAEEEKEKATKKTLKEAKKRAKDGDTLENFLDSTPKEI